MSESGVPERTEGEFDLTKMSEAFQKELARAVRENKELARAVRENEEEKKRKNTGWTPVIKYQRALSLWIRLVADSRALLTNAARLLDSVSGNPSKLTGVDKERYTKYLKQGVKVGQVAEEAYLNAERIRKSFGRGNTPEKITKDDRNKMLEQEKFLLPDEFDALIKKSDKDMLNFETNPNAIPGIVGISPSDEIVPTKK
jgi:hypothetical protein